MLEYHIVFQEKNTKILNIYICIAVLNLALFTGFKRHEKLPVYLCPFLFLFHGEEKHGEEG